MVAEDPSPEEARSEAAIERGEPPLREMKLCLAIWTLSLLRPAEIRR